ncbi:MAG: hypothetical protein ACLTBV_18520 [Enterocloster bolteae]
MVPLKELTAETVLSDDVLTEVFDQEDELVQVKAAAVTGGPGRRAGGEKKFQELVKAYKRVEREMRRRERDKKNQPCTLEQWTSV